MISRIISHSAIAVGLVLLMVTCLGEWSALGEFGREPPRTWERYDASLAARASNLKDLFLLANERANGELETLPQKQAMQILFDVTTERFTHGAPTHNLFSNWLLWLGGSINPAFADVRSPSNLLARSNSAICSASSSILMQLALRAGIRPRHVGLHGHVVMEAWYEGGWHMYDPDYEVVAADSMGQVLGVLDLTINQSAIRRLYGDRAGGERALDELIRIFTSIEDNSFVSYPPGSQFEWKSQVLLLFEDAADFLKWIIPIMLLATGAWLISRRSTK